jgi:3-oxoadipate enol-lactonase
MELKDAQMKLKGAGLEEVRIGGVPGAPRLTLSCAGAGELAIFLHGVGGNRDNWATQLPAFAQHFRAVAWDARGYGDSDDYEGVLRFSDYADDLVRVLDFFDAESAHIVGLSMGGNIALDFAGRYPTRVRSLVLCDTDRGMAHLPEAERRQFVRLRSQPLIAGGRLCDIAPDIVNSLLGPRASAEARAALTESLLRLHPVSYVKSVQATVDFDGRLIPSLIGCPTLVVVGEFDSLTPLSEARQISSQIAGSHLAVIPDAGHLSNIEQPESFNREVLNFLLSVIKDRYKTALPSVIAAHRLPNS